MELPHWISNHDDFHQLLRRRLQNEPGTWSVFIEPLGAGRPAAAINPDVIMRSASVWKVTAMVEAFRQRATGVLRFDETLIVNARVMERAGWSSAIGLGQAVSVRRAMQLMMSVSDNGAAILLGDRLGYARIDKTMAELGLRRTVVNLSYTTTSARDMRILLGFALGERWRACTCPVGDSAEMLALLLSESRDDRIPALLPPGTPVAHKTGDLPGVVNDAGVIYLPSGPVIAVFLVNNSPDRGRTVATLSELARLTYDAFASAAADSAER